MRSRLRRVEKLEAYDAVAMRSINLTHLQAMLVFAFLVSAAFGALTKHRTVDRVKAAAWTFLLFIVIAVAIGWLMYPFSR